MRLKAPLRKFLERERVAHVATISRHGVPHVVPVCHVLEDGKIYFAADKDSKKSKTCGRVQRRQWRWTCIQKIGRVWLVPSSRARRLSSIGDPAFGSCGASFTKSIPSTRTSPPSREEKL
jgi:hypothetical protein